MVFPFNPPQSIYCDVVLPYTKCLNLLGEFEPRVKQDDQVRATETEDR